MMYKEKMNSNNFVLLLVFGWTFVLAGGTYPGTKGEVVIGNRLYRSEYQTFMNWQQATEYCKTNGGELAKIAGKPFFDSIPPSLPKNGTYWIDGTDIAGTNRFITNKDCAPGDLSLSNIPMQNKNLTLATCLSFVIGVDPDLPNVKGFPCEYFFKGVICAIPTAGCKKPY